MIESCDRPSHLSSKMTLPEILETSQYRFYNRIAEMNDTINNSFKNSSLVLKPVGISDDGLTISMELSVSDPLFCDLGFVPHENVKKIIAKELLQLVKTDTNLTFCWSDNKRFYIRYKL